MTQAVRCHHVAQDVGSIPTPAIMHKKGSQWSAKEEALLQQYTEQGLPIAQIASAMKRSFGSIANKQGSMNIGVVRSQRTPYRDGDKPHTPLDAAIFAGATDGNIPEWVDALRPVQLPAPPIPTVRTSPNN